MSIAGPVSGADQSPAQRLAAALRYDGECWQVRVTTADGQVPPGPLRGDLEATGTRVGLVRTLWPSDRGVWSDRWDDHLRQGGGPGKVRIWVGAPGYVTAMVSQAADGTPVDWK